MYFAKTNLSSGRGKKVPGFVPNQRIPDDAFPPEELARLVKAGDVMEVAKADVTEPVEVPKEAKQDTEVIDRGLWTFRAEDLADINIDQLNMMIAQHVDKHGIGAVDPFGDEEEAILFMTSDNKE